MSDQTKRGTWYLYFLFYFSLNKTVFESNFINSTNETANIEYGDVHQWWAADNPKIVDDSPGIIQVYSICHSKVCYSNILQATGTGCVSGSYIIQFPGEKFKIEFEFSEDVYPYIKATKLPGTTNPNNFHVDMLRPPRVDHLKAKVTFQVVDPQWKKECTMSKLDKK